MSDLIDRQAAINEIEHHIRTAEQPYQLTDADRIMNHAFEIAASCIYNLPDAEPERKTGKWIYGEHDVAMCDGYWCDKCGFFVPWDYEHKFIDFINDYHFCPSCGAKMEGNG